jgi:hypothetical protein
MAIELTGIDPRHEYRVRLVFSNTLAVGAFTNLALYTVTNDDGKGPTPTVLAALVVPGNAQNVELALSAPLVEGALYTLSAVGVPAADASVSTSASIRTFRIGVSNEQPNQEPKASNVDLLLYGRDAVWAGDYVESAESDLATVEGVPNARGAVRRRILGSPLPWDRSYSPNAYESVDLPSTAVGGLKGRIQSQAIVDDRVRAAQVVFVADDPEDVHFDVFVTLVGGQAPGAIAVEIDA